MPIVEVAGVGEVEFPDSMSQDQIKSVLDQKFGSKKQGATNKEYGELNEIGSAPELNQMSVPAFKASLGLLTTGDSKSLEGIFKSQFGDDVSFDEVDGRSIVNLPSGSYEMNKKGFSGQDIARFTAQALSFTPAGRAGTVASAIGKNALTQTAIDATEGSVGGEGVNASESLVAGALGGTFKGAENTIGTAYRGLKGRVAQSAKETIEAGKDSGIKVLTSDVLPPQNFISKNLQSTAEKIPFIGTGAVRETQEAARKTAVDDVIQQYGEYSYEAIIESLKSQKNRVKNAAGSVLQAAGDKLDEAGEIALPETRLAITKAFDALGKTNVIKSEGTLKDLAKISETVLDNPQTFTSLKENRTALRDIIDSVDIAGRSQLASREKGLLNNIYKSMTREMETVAKEGLDPAEFIKWQRANAVYAEEATKLTRTKLKTVLDKGGFTPETVKQMLFSKNPSEVKLLYGSLTNEGRQNVRAAIINNAVDTLSKRANGITPNTFAAEMRKMGLQSETFFKGAEAKKLSGFLKVLDSTRRAGDASVATPTGQSLFAMLGLGAGTIAPEATIGTALTISTLARAYESPAVRNVLLRLDSLPKHSTRFESVLRDAQTVLNSTLQSYTDEQGSEAPAQ